VQTQFGWHIIKAESRRDTKMPTLAESKDEITQALQEEKLKETLAKLREGAKVEKFNMDGTPMASAAPATPAPAKTETPAKVQ
jgi:peptidyl-prolyl cis-trans isomerase C